MRVGIIGGGLVGLGTAWQLSHEADFRILYARAYVNVFAMSIEGHAPAKSFNGNKR